MKYNKTPTFNGVVASMDADIAELSARLDQLARTIEARKQENVNLSKSKKKPTQDLENRQASCRTKLEELVKLRCRFENSEAALFNTGDIFNMLIDVEKNAWSEEERRLGETGLESYEGPYEKSLRLRKGWPIAATQESADFPDDGEGKYLASPLETFRSGKFGKRAWGRVYRSIVREHTEEMLLPEQWEDLMDGEVSAGKIYNTMPANIQNKIQTSLAPEVVLSPYRTMYMLMDYGYIEVPRKDYDKAFSLSSVTQMSPKYRLKRNYLEERLFKSSAKNNQTTAAA